MLIVTVATFCARRPEGLERHDLIKVLALAAVPILLVVKQPDLGSGIVMSVVLLVMLVVAGIPNRYLVLLLVVLPWPGRSPSLHCGLLKAYQLNRLTSFLHQGKNLQGTAYNLDQSVAAIGSGGFTGHGAVPRAADQPAVRARAADRLHLLGRGRAARVRRARPASCSSSGRRVVAAPAGRPVGP